MAMGQFEKSDETAQTGTEECVLVALNVDPLPEEFWLLQDKLYEVMGNSDVGEFDGNEIGTGTATLFFYGPDANQIIQVVGPVLKQYSTLGYARVVIRKGPPGSPETEVQL
jgi:hypothetical protein